MGEVYLSWNDICSHYPNQWVLIARPSDRRRIDVLGGWVLAHSTEEHEVVLAMDLTPIDYDLALVHTDMELAKTMADTVYTLEYLAWRPIFEDEIECYDSSPTPPTHSVKRRWWQFWR